MATWQAARYMAQTAEAEVPLLKAMYDGAVQTCPDREKFHFWCAEIAE